MAEERKVEAGQSIHGALSYRTVNTMIELVRQQRLERLGQQGGDAQDSSVAGGLEVFVQNETGSFQPPGAILSIEQGTPLDPLRNAGEFVQRPCFSGAVPFDEGDVVAVLRDGADVGEVSLAVLRGIAVVALDVTSLLHGRAVPVPGDTSQMTSNTEGHPILWTETGGTGAQQAVVLLDAWEPCCPPTMIGKDNSTTNNSTSHTLISNGSSQTRTGDVVVFGLAADGACTITPPAGWTTLYSGQLPGAGRGYFVGWRRLTANTETYVFTTSVAVRLQAQNVTVHDGGDVCGYATDSANSAAPNTPRLLYVPALGRENFGGVPFGSFVYCFIVTQATTDPPDVPQSFGHLIFGLTGTATGRYSQARVAANVHTPARVLDNELCPTLSGATNWLTAVVVVPPKYNCCDPDVVLATT